MRLVAFCCCASLAACSATGDDPPLLDRTRVQVPTATSGTLQREGLCWFLDGAAARHVILWTEGTRFGRDERGHHVTDRTGTRRYAGQSVALAGGRVGIESLRAGSRIEEYARRCGSSYLVGNYFSGERP